MPYKPIPEQPQKATEEETLAAIRAVLTETETPEASRLVKHALNSDTPEQAVGRTVFGTVFTRDTQPEAAPRFRGRPDTPHAAPAAPKRALFMELKTGVNARLLPLLPRVRPSLRQVVLASLALLFILRPHWFLISGILSAACVVGLFLGLGADRIWRAVVSYLVRLEARDPVKGAQLRARLDLFACRWDSILDRLPDGTVDGLYMPDLQQMESAEAAHMDAVTKRLDRMALDA